jgi:phospholipase C
MYIISPWSKGGWVNSQVFDHTSVIRFIEARFGVHEPNISPWRRAVCGDLTSAFNFNEPNNDASSLSLPDTQKQANLAQSLPSRTIPETPATISLPVQTKGVRSARALPYELDVRCNSIKLDHHDAKVPVIELLFLNTGSAAAVFHVYDRLNLNAIPHRYTVEANKKLTGNWLAETGFYDLWVLGPNGFHRHFTGDALEVSNAKPDIQVTYHKIAGEILLILTNKGNESCVFKLITNKYYKNDDQSYKVGANSLVKIRLPLRKNAYWYDFSVTVEGKDMESFSRRFAGHLETGRSSFTDPAMYGTARSTHDAITNAPYGLIRGNKV